MPSSFKFVFLSVQSMILMSFEKFSKLFKSAVLADRRTASRNPEDSDADNGREMRSRDIPKLSVSKYPGFTLNNRTLNLFLLLESCWTVSRCVIDSVINLDDVLMTRLMTLSTSHVEVSNRFTIVYGGSTSVTWKTTERRTTVRDLLTVVSNLFSPPERKTSRFGGVKIPKAKFRKTFVLGINFNHTYGSW